MQQTTTPAPAALAHHLSAAAPPTVELAPRDARSVSVLACEYARAAASLPTERSLRLAALMAHELPRPLRRTLTDYRLSGQPSAGFLISGLSLDERAAAPSASTRRPGPSLADAVLLLAGSLLGDPGPYQGRSAGQLVVDQFPAAGTPGPRRAGHVPGARRTDWTMLLCLRATDALTIALADHRTQLRTDPGDLFVVDNQRAAYGLRTSDPDHGPADPWFRRLDLTAGLRRRTDAHNGERVLSPTP